MSGLPVPIHAVGITLYKAFGKDKEDVRGTETIMFVNRSGLETTLRRAAISGKVEIGETVKLENYFADLCDKEGDTITHVALDAKSFKALKQQWLRRPKYVS